MTKAEYRFITDGLDKALLADIALHGKLWADWDAIAKVDQDDPRIAALSDKTTDLARRIAVTPAHTAAARDAKIHVIKLEELEAWDDLGLIRTILKMDAERISAAG